MVINQGDIYWINLGRPSGSSPGYLRPFAIIQNDIFNISRINTVIVCALTSNLKLAKAPGNILLNQGEANLPKQSVINVSQIYSVDKLELKEKIGTLSSKRVQEILDGIRLLLEPQPAKV